MVKNSKKRSVSESEVAGKTAQESNVNKTMKRKKTENGAVHNGETNKEVKSNPQKKVNVQKAGNEGSPDKNKKQTADKQEKKSQMLKKRQEYRTQRKQEGRNHSKDISADDLKRKIQEIEKRGNISKSAKRKLASLKKLLLVKDGTVVPKKQIAKKQAEKVSANKKQVQSNEEQKKKVPEKVEAKPVKENKKDAKQGNLLLIKQKVEAKVEEDEDDDDSEVEEIEVDSAESEDEDESDVEEEEDDDEEVEAEEEEEDDEDDEDDEEEDEDDKEADVKSDVQPPKAKGKPQENKEQQDGKKKRYVLFVGNIPFDATAEELEKHFLTKVSEVTSVRIPKRENSDASRGFAYVELSNSTDYEKALLLNHSFLKGRRINVQYSTNDRKESVAKNYKLQALQRAGKLAGGPNKNYQKNFGRKGGKPYMQRTKT